MALIIRSVHVHQKSNMFDVTTMGDEEQQHVKGPTIVEFSMEGFVQNSEDAQLLFEYAQDGLLELFTKLAQCEWCGSLYPRKDLRCRRGCGGPMTKVR